MSPAIGWLLACFLFIKATGHAGEWEVRITPREGDNFSRAALRLRWDRRGPPAAVLLLAPGWNGDGRMLVRDADWSSFAARWKVALVGVAIQSDLDRTEPYHIADGGSGRALLEGLEQLATLSGHREISQLPLLAWGHSAGGQLAYGLACVAPGRVRAFAAIKGGFYETRFNPLTCNVPGIWVIGGRDAQYRAEGILRVVADGRHRGARWCLAWDRSGGHEIGRANEVILPFFEDVLRAHELRSSTPWLGNRATYKLRQYEQTFQFSTSEVWLPGESSARAWIALERQ